jgi:hypothetical protein
MNNQWLFLAHGLNLVSWNFPFVTTKQSFVTIRKKAIRNSTNITSRNSRAQELFSTIRNAN